MSRTKKAALGAGAVLGSLLLLLLILPFLFADQIEARVRAEVERATKVTISWTDTGLTFFRDFPNPTLSLSGLTAVGTDRFEGDTLAHVGHFRIALGGRSVVRALRGTGPLEVRSVRIVDPDLRLRVDEEGLSNWDILEERDSDGGAASSGGMSVSLRRLSVSDGRVLFDNAASGVYASITGLTHSLRGDFSSETLGADAQLEADEVTVRLGGVPYVSSVRLEFDAEVDVDMAQRTVRFTDNALRLNALDLRLDGEVGHHEDGVEARLTLNAPSTDFGSLLSLVPVIYASDFASLETAGSFTIDAEVDGVYGPASFPSFSLAVAVRDGSFRYPDLALPAEAITADLSITNPGGHVDSTVVNLRDFHIEIDGQPIDASLTLRTPLSDPDAEAEMRGTVDLSALARTVKLRSAQGLTGVVEADARIRARRSDVDSARYERIVAAGVVTARDVALRNPALRQPIDVRVATVRLTPQAGRLEALDARVGSSDVQATGSLDNLLGYALGQETLRGSGTFTSPRLLLDEWRSEDELRTIAVPAMLDFTLDGSMEELVFNGIEMRQARGRAVVRDQRVTFENVSLEAFGGRIDVDGFYEAIEETPASFALDLVMDSLDVSESSAALLSMRTLAPAAAYARGSFSSEMRLTGTLGEDMAPNLEVLDGTGSLSTSSLAIEGMPILQRLSETLDLQRLSNPTVGAVRSTVRIEDGRLIVDPFQLPIEGLTMTVSGSNGIDQSIDYSLGLRVPRSGVAENVLSGLASRTGPLGASLATLDTIRVAVRATGTVRQPSLAATLSETTRTARDAATQATRAAVDERIDEARQRAEAERAAARERAAAEADSIVAEARRQADVVRAEAANAAARIRAEGDRAAEELLSRATSPLARAAAQPAADRIRREAGERATTLEREADEQATAIVSAAEARAEAIRGGSGEDSPSTDLAMRHPEH